jgi:hypothetical protein
MKQRVAALAIITLFGALGSANASIIGSLFTGSAGSVVVTLTSINWQPDASANPFPGPPWNGEIANPTALMFNGCASGVTGTLGCLTIGDGVVINNNVSLTPSSVLPEDHFLQFANHAALDYTLTTVFTGSTNLNCSGLSVGQSCSLFLNSPIILTLGAGNRTSASINLAGTATDGVGPISNWAGGFSATIPNETPAQIQAFFCPGGSCTNTTGSISGSNSGSFFATTVPEPGTFAFIGGGLIGLATLLRRRKNA